jgi:tRNA (adenine58-N1)-methyltransferase non-catalytic subunit
MISFEDDQIKPHHFIVMVDNSGNRRVIKAGSGKIHHHKCNIDFNFVLGKPFNTVFRVLDRASGELEVVDDPQTYLTSAFFTGIDDSESDEEMKDNRAIVDDNTNQKLTHEDITAMKQQTTDGKQIIEALIQNSQSWNQRTKFSQAKYLARKERKYAISFEARKPSSLELCEFYNSEFP